MSMPSAAEYRKRAEECEEIARRMSLRDDRERLLLIAQRWRQHADPEDEAARPPQSN
jgi:hypothetical protein